MVTIANVDDEAVHVAVLLIDAAFVVGFTVMLTHGVSLRTNLNIDSTKLAGVDSLHFSNDSTIQCCRLAISLKQSAIAHVLC